jgi:hypothetical protein
MLRAALLALVAALALTNGAHAAAPTTGRKMLQVLYGTTDLQTRQNVAQNAAQQAIARAFLPTRAGGSSGAATQEAALATQMTVGSVAFGNNGYLLSGK